MSTYPSVISTISNPNPTDKLNSPSHSGIETSQNDAISKLETFIGTLSSVQGTLMYDIRASESDGGGHVQGVNKGGTGQTNYNKGDILIASSSSVLSKLAIGNNNQILTADSAQPGGIKWGEGAATATNIQNQTYTYARASVISASVYGVILGQAVSILSDGLGLVVKFPKANASSIVALQVNATGPSSLTALVKNTALNNLAVGDIQASLIAILEFDSVSSVFQILNTNVSSISSGPTGLSIAPVPMVPVDYTGANNTQPSSLQGILTSFLLPISMVVNRLGIRTNNSAGTSISAAIYSEGGAQQASVTGFGFGSNLGTAYYPIPIASVALSAGIYYLAVTALVGTHTFLTHNGLNSGGATANTSPGKRTYTGSILLAAGVLPASITGTAISPAADLNLDFRLDN